MKRANEPTNEREPQKVFFKLNSHVLGNATKDRFFFASLFDIESRKFKKHENSSKRSITETVKSFVWYKNRFTTM